MLFRRSLILLIAILGALAAFRLLASILAVPQYDLLFSIDYNDHAYSDPASTGIVIRVNNHKANVIFTGKWQAGVGPDVPSLYLCEVAYRSVREIPISFQPQPNAGDDPFPLKRQSSGTPIDVPELDLLAVAGSSTAPNGYALHGFRGLSPFALSFENAYAYINLVDTWPVPNAVQLKEDTYEACLAGC